MAFDQSLPFERGKTWKDGNTGITATPNVQFLGTVFPTTDGESDINTGHNTGRSMELRAIVALAATTLTKRGLRASTLNTQSSYWGFNGSGDNGVGTGSAFVPDDRYDSGTAIAQGDIIYAIARGPARVRCSVTAGNWAVGSPLSWTGGGNLRIAGTATGNHHIVAIAREVATTVNVAKLVDVIG